MITTQELFDLEHTMARELLSGFEYPYEALPHIKSFVYSLIQSLDKSEYYSPCEGVWISNGATVAKSALIEAPTVICKNTEIRHNAYIRGGVLVGEGCVIGNSTELKNCIIFDNAQVPHFNYVGDSILGYRSHLGAGAIISNLKSDKSNVTLKLDGERKDTGLRKFGAMVGDFVEVGCNSVLNPGTVIGRNSNVYPTSCVRGIVPANSIHKNNGEITPKLSDK